MSEKLFKAMGFTWMFLCLFSFIYHMWDVPGFRGVFWFLLGFFGMTWFTTVATRHIRKNRRLKESPLTTDDVIKLIKTDMVIEKVKFDSEGKVSTLDGKPLIVEK